MLGSGGVIIMDEDTCMVKAALRIMRFYAHESCGWCIPCREGTTWLKKILTRFHEGGGYAERHQSDRRPCEEHAGPHVLPAGRRGGDADDLDSSKSSAHEFEDHLDGKPCPYEHVGWCWLVHG